MRLHGKWLVRGTLAAAAAAVAIIAAGCQKTAPMVAPPPPEVAVTTVIQRDVPVYSNWVGTTEGFVNAQIHPKVSGYILKQVYQDGDHVRAEQLLFQIDDREYKAALDQALSDLAQKQADLKKNQQDLARYKPLLAEQVISRQDYDHVNQTTHASAAAAQAAQAAVETAKLNFEWTRVFSPIDGVAGIAKTQVGDLVSPTTLLTTVSQLDPIKVTFPISEREYLHFAVRIREHQEKGVAKGEPTLEMILADGTIYPQPGHFYVANREVNVQTGTIKIQGIFPNHDYILRPGLYAKIRSATDVLPNALLVPERAVLETQGQYQVGVVGADNRVSLRTVKPGKSYDDLQVIEEGVAPGERVIIEGIQKVTDGMQVKVRVVPVQPVPAAQAAAPSQGAVPASQN
ncbi:MAG TPA: efflux RND transporter periplasmic adaptor subunit [Candidatus Binataceae bacterium]|jgi:membrane fusion protein (multidrug efflux system)|nr:efflux RND transporter periplasmic adaptor subunit [Candidatus Binataceae bacterium]